MDHHETSRDTGGHHPTSRRAERGRRGADRSSERVAAAAKAAVDGLQGIQRTAEPSARDVARAPGVGVLFGSMTPVPEAPPRTVVEPPDPELPGDLTIDLPRGPAPAAAPDAAAPDAAAPDAAAPAAVPEDGAEVDADAGSSVSGSEPSVAGTGVWNPFRQVRPSNPGSPVARPGISHLHIRRNATEATVIATLDHAGRLAHGTAVGPPVMPGMLRAVAEATVASLRVLVNVALPIRVEQVTVLADDDPPSVSVVVIWMTDRGEERMAGGAIVRDDVERAVMQATLDALGRRLEPLF